LTKKQRQSNGEKIIFPANGATRTGYLHAKKMNLNTEFTPFTKISSKWNTDLIVLKNKTIKPLEDTTSEDTTPKA